MPGPRGLTKLPGGSRSQAEPGNENLALDLPELFSDPARAGRAAAVPTSCERGSGPGRSGTPSGQVRSWCICRRATYGSPSDVSAVRIDLTAPVDPAASAPLTLADTDTAQSLITAADHLTAAGRRPVLAALAPPAPPMLGQLVPQ